jgi:hypothetical protein
MNVGFRLSEIKKMFVDTDAVKNAVDKATLKVLAKFGAFVRTTSKRSIRSAGKKNATSQQGEPPRSHTGLLKKFIFFGVEKDKQNVVIGPAKLNKPGYAAQALEEGGRSIRSDGKSITIHARPFMKPAFDKEIVKAPDMWRNAVKA